MSELGPFATEFDRWAAGYLSGTTAQVNLVLPPMRAAWQARARIAEQEKRELVEEMKRRVFGLIAERIDQQPRDGMTASGVFDDTVEYGQTKFVDGMRLARLTAIMALDALLAKHEAASERGTSDVE